MTTIQAHIKTNTPYIQKTVKKPKNQKTGAGISIHKEHGGKYFLCFTEPKNIHETTNYKDNYQTTLTCTEILFRKASKQKTFSKVHFPPQKYLNKEIILMEITPELQTTIRIKTKQPIIETTTRPNGKTKAITRLPQKTTEKKALLIPLPRKHLTIITDTDNMKEVVFQDDEVLLRTISSTEYSSTVSVPSIYLGEKVTIIPLESKE